MDTAKLIISWKCNLDCDIINTDRYVLEGCKYD